jgi:hypothetical protein
MSNWSPGETERLIKLYQENNITSDTLIKDSLALSNFTQLFNQQPGFSTTEKEIAGKLLRLRKSGKLPRLRH